MQAAVLSPENKCTGHKLWNNVRVVTCKLDLSIQQASLLPHLSPPPIVFLTRLVGM